MYPSSPTNQSNRHPHKEGGPPWIRTTTTLRNPPTIILPSTQKHVSTLPSTMCIIYRKIYPSCGHHASGTVPETNYCENAGPRFERCQVGAGLEYQNEYYDRGYCDACIMAGIELAKAKGLDMDVYARSMGVRLSDLLSAHPSWRP